MVSQLIPLKPPSKPRALVPVQASKHAYYMEGIKAASSLVALAIDSKVSMV